MTRAQAKARATVDCSEKAAQEKGQSSTDDWPFDLNLRGPLRPSAFQKRLKLTRPRRVAEFAERLGFDLADAFARDGEVLADLFERVLAAVRAQSEAHLDDLLLARRQRLQHLLRDFAEVDVDDGLGGVLDGLVLDEIAEVRIFLFSDGRFQRDRLLGDLEDFSDLRRRDVHLLGDLFRSRLAAELLP